MLFSHNLIRGREYCIIQLVSATRNLHFRLYVNFPKVYEVLMVNTHIATDTHSDAHTLAWKRLMEEGLERRKTENVRTEMRKKDWLILPLVVFLRCLIQPHPHPTPYNLSTSLWGWFDVSFFLINSTFASITQQKHTSEGRGWGSAREWLGWVGAGDSPRECGRQPPCSAFQAFVIPGNLFPVNVLSQ